MYGILHFIPVTTHAFRKLMEFTQSIQFWCEHVETCKKISQSIPNVTESTGSNMHFAASMLESYAVPGKINFISSTFAGIGSHVSYKIKQLYQSSDHGENFFSSITNIAIAGSMATPYALLIGDHKLVSYALAQQIILEAGSYTAYKYEENTKDISGDLKSAISVDLLCISVSFFLWKSTKSTYNGFLEDATIFSLIGIDLAFASITGVWALGHSLISRVDDLTNYFETETAHLMGEERAHPDSEIL